MSPICRHFESMCIQVNEWHLKNCFKEPTGKVNVKTSCSLLVPDFIGGNIVTTLALT